METIGIVLKVDGIHGSDDLVVRAQCIKCQAMITERRWKSPFDESEEQLAAQGIADATAGFEHTCHDA